jgi:hypothetical protein
MLAFELDRLAHLRAELAAWRCPPIEDDYSEDSGPDSSPEDEEAD